MVWGVIGSILHGGDPLSYFSFQPVLHDWCNKAGGMCYPVCGMVHIKELLLLIEKSSQCSGKNRFPLLLIGWSFTICLTIDYSSLQAVLNDFSNKDCGECYHVCRIGYIKNPCF